MLENKSITKKSMNPKKYWPSKIKSKEDRLKMKRRLVDYLGGKCIDCGYKAHLAALDFDHIDPKAKSFGLAQKMGYLDYLDLLEEVKKCVLRCANCHRIKTFSQATD